MLKELPRNNEVEKIVLSNIFKENDLLADTMSAIKAEDFYNKGHTTIYSSMCKLYNKNTPITAEMLFINMGKDKYMAVGGTTYISELISQSLSTVGHDKYVYQVKELSNQRRLITESQKCIDSIFNGTMKSIDFIENMERVNMNVCNHNEEEGQYMTCNTETLMLETFESVEECYKNGGQAPGIPTGFMLLDKHMNGFEKGTLNIIAARPSMGKTALLLSIMNNTPPRYKALVFEMEMTRNELGKRMLASNSKINMYKVNRGQLTSDEWVKVSNTSNRLVKKTNLFINTQADLSVSEIRRECKNIKSKYGLDIIFVDHIGKIKKDSSSRSLNEKVGETVNSLKNMAKELNISVVLLSQLNRGVESRTDKHPMMSDLRDSGNIEQDADKVIMLYRDDYYAEREHRDSRRPNILEVDIQKQRNGQCGIVKLYYDTTTQFIGDMQI